MSRSTPGGSSLTDLCVSSCPLVTSEDENQMSLRSTPNDRLHGALVKELRPTSCNSVSASARVVLPTSRRALYVSACPRRTTGAGKRGSYWAMTIALILRDLTGPGYKISIQRTTSQTELRVRTEKLRFMLECPLDYQSQIA